MSVSTLKHLGSINRQALPVAPVSQAAADPDVVLPRNDLESKLANIWQEVLNISEVSIHSDFFALGGSSLLAVCIVSRILGDLNLELPVRDFFANPTIATQATHISSLLKQPNDEENNQIDDSHQNSLALRKRLPQIEASYFDSAEERLFGIHYRPQKAQQSQSHAVLICHPLGHEYSRAYRNLQQFSLHLSQAGFNIFRFDYAGTGNSSGSSQDAIASDYINDIRTTADYIRQHSQCKKLSIIALRMGAPLAVSANVKDLENLILWDPVVEGSHYINLLQEFHNKALSKLERFRMKRKPSEVQQLYGYAMSQKQRQSLSELQLPCLRALNRTGNSPEKIVMITSSTYQSSEPCRLDLLEHCLHFATKDEIQWHDRLYAESAFSSPEAFKTMMNVLKGEQL